MDVPEAQPLTVPEPAPRAQPPVRVVVGGELERSRVTVLLRLFMALPHLIVLGAFATAVVLMAPVVWLVALVKAELPAAVHEFYARTIRYAVQVYAYLYLLAQPWPRFGAGPYPLDVELPATPVRQNRWTIGFRLLLALPAFLLAGALGTGSATASVSAASFSLGVLPTLAFLGWFASLARGRVPPGMRDLGAYALGYGAQAYAYALLVTPRYPDSDPARAELPPLPEHPVTLELRDADLARPRLMVFFRFLLALPHLIWLTLWGVAALFAAVAAWFAAVATGRVPVPLHRFLSALVRYQTHVAGFLYLVAHPFPGFTGAPGSYPLELRVAPPERQSRWTVLFRWLLAVPAALVAGALAGVQTVAALLAWWVALFTGRMPRGLRDLMAFTLRYSAQLSAYGLLLTPRYPYSGPGRCAG